MDKQLKIFYDGACFVCHTEIEIYRKHDTGKKLSFIDISLLNFDNQDMPVSKYHLNKYFHIQLPSGLYLNGVDAFMEIWKVLPKWRKLEKLTNNFIFKPMLKIGYFFFVYARPYLPKRRKCTSDACKI